jgi:CheY-like chemotaxis protein
MTGTTLDVLVVTDDAARADETGSALDRHGFEARVVGGAGEALRSAATDPPDVVLIDFTRPGLEGPGLARSLRDQTWIEQPLLIAVTARRIPAAPREPAGIDLYLEDPVGSAILIDVLNRFRTFLLAGRRGGARDVPVVAAPSDPFRPVVG